MQLTPWRSKMFAPMIHRSNKELDALHGDVNHLLSNLIYDFDNGIMSSMSLYPAVDIAEKDNKY